MSPSIILREYHNESTEKSPTVLADDRRLSGLLFARIVDLSHDLEAVELVPTYMVQYQNLGEGHNGRKKDDGVPPSIIGIRVMIAGGELF